MSNIAVIYYSAADHVHKLALALTEGARDAGAEVRLRPVADATLDDLRWADGFAFGPAKRYGLPAAELKWFIDQTGLRPCPRNSRSTLAGGLDKPRRNAMIDPDMIAVEPLDEAVDHVRGPSGGHLILEYGDYECPYSRAAYRQIQRVLRTAGAEVRFAFRHFPLTEIHPHALAASAAAEAAALQDRFWEMHDLLYHRQRALEDDDLRRYATELELDVTAFDSDREGPGVLARIGRDVESGLASRQVRGTPTLFVDGAVHRGGYDAAELLEAVAR